MLGVEALLGWALDAAGPSDPGVARVKRAVRHLAGGVEKALAATSATPAEALESAWAEYEKRASLDPEERPAAAAAVGAAAGRIAALPLTAAEALESSLPHRSPTQRAQLADGFLGLTTWQRIAIEFGLAPDQLPDVVTDLPGWYVSNGLVDPTAEFSGV